MARMNIKIIIENYDYNCNDLKMKYYTNTEINDVSYENVVSLMECIKCGINAFEDEVAERTDGKDKPRFLVNIVEKPDSDAND